MHKRFLSLALGLAAAAVAVSAIPVDAAGNRNAVSYQQILINQDRAASHERALAWSPCLAQFALRQARAMAARQGIFHSNVLRMTSCRLHSRWLGENVGDLNTGGAGLSQVSIDQTLNSAFMASPHHRANILGPFRYVGTAWVARNGVHYIAVEFG